MQYYDYTVRMPESGKIKKGVSSSENIEKATVNLIEKGFTVIDVSPIQDFLSIRKTIYSIRYKIKKKNIKDFFDQLSFMLNTNLSMNSALLILRDSGVDKKLKYINCYAVDNKTIVQCINLTVVLIIAVSFLS